MRYLSKAHHHSKFTIFENEAKSFRDIDIDDTRLESFENPLKRVVLQELSKKSKDVIRDWKKKDVFHLKFQPK